MPAEAKISSNTLELISSLATNKGHWLRIKIWQENQVEGGQCFCGELYYMVPKENKLFE